MEVFVHSSGNEQPEVVEIEEVALIRTLIVESEPDSGIWLEEIDEEIDLDITIEVAGIRHHHHVHRGHCRRVEVTVRFNGVSHEHEYGPATTIKTVRTWAFGPNVVKLLASRRPPSTSSLSPAQITSWTTASTSARCHHRGSCVVDPRPAAALTVRGMTELIAPDERTFRAHLDRGRFLAGVAAGHWRLVEIDWPHVA